MNGWQNELVRRWVFGYLDGTIMAWIATMIVLFLAGVFG